MALARRGRESYDVVLKEAPSGAIGQSLVNQLGVKGFCTVDLGLEAGVLKKATEDAKELMTQGKFYQPAFQIMEGLLGPEGSSKVAELDPDVPDLEIGEALKTLDSELHKVGSEVIPFMGNIGADVSHRTATVLHETGAADDETPPLTEKEVAKWLGQFSKHKLMAIIFLGPSKGTLELRPYNNNETESFEVRSLPGMMVLLRPDMMAHKYFAPGKAMAVSCFFLPGKSKRQSTQLCPIARELDEWVMDRLRQIKDAETQDTLWDPEIPREWQQMMNHMFHKGQMVSIGGLSCRFTGSWEPSIWAMTFATGPDIVTEVPLMRWDHTKFYDSDPDGFKQYKTCCKHGQFSDGHDLFDAKLFGITVAEAKVLDPNQRVVLEVGYDALYRAGYRKKTLMNAQCGMYAGFGTLEWIYMAFCGIELPDAGAFGATGGAASIVSNRMSFCMGMKGPSMSIDAEGASSMVAVFLGAEGVQKKGRATPNQMSLSTGIHMMLCPIYWPQQNAAGWLSKEGRCFTFDQSADGFARSDGAAGCVTRLLNDIVDGQEVQSDQTVVGILAGASMNQNGQGASLHAPSGPAEQEVIAEAIRNAYISIFDVDACEAHGAGVFLHDAIEMASHARAHRTEQCKDPIPITALKTNVGNGVEVGGIAGFIRAIFGQQSMNLYPQAHLTQVNPHIETADFNPACMVTECCEYRMESSFVGCLSRGFGGTNVYGLSFGQADNEKAEQYESSSGGIAYWPGGGGSMEDGMKPEKNYTIIGSFNRWEEPIPMTGSGEGTYVYTITLGENAFEQFQVWLDGDSSRVLHPGYEKGEKDSTVWGPSSTDEAHGLNWIIDGRDDVQKLWRMESQAIPDAETEDTFEDDLGNKWLLQTVTVTSADSGKPGDQYRVKLHVAGKWRTVNWTKLESKTSELAALPSGKYFVVGSWNEWSFEEMTESSPGSFSYTTPELLRPGGEFQIVRDCDWFQVLHPSNPSGTTEDYINGPADGGHGLNWNLRGSQGDKYQIDFTRKVEEGKDTKKISWKKL